MRTVMYKQIDSAIKNEGYGDSKKHIWITLWILLTNNSSKTAFTNISTISQTKSEKALIQQKNQNQTLKSSQIIAKSNVYSEHTLP